MGGGDNQKAREWYEKAAEQGNADAQCSLGQMYYEGIVVKRDYQKAREWWEKAAEQGDSKAQQRLGWMIIMGKT
jgi:TPR repeat protein